MNPSREENRMGALVSQEVRDDVEMCRLHPEVVRMACGILNTGMAAAYLADRGTQGRACDEAHRRGVPFRFIGSPDRAIRVILGAQS